MFKSPLRCWRCRVDACLIGAGAERQLKSVMVAIEARNLKRRMLWNLLLFQQLLSDPIARAFVTNLIFAAHSLPSGLEVHLAQGTEEFVEARVFSNRSSRKARDGVAEGLV